MHHCPQSLNRIYTCSQWCRSPRAAPQHTPHAAETPRRGSVVQHLVLVPAAVPATPRVLRNNQPPTVANATLWPTGVRSRPRLQHEPRSLAWMPSAEQCFAPAPWQIASAHPSPSPRSCFRTQSLRCRWAAERPGNASPTLGDSMLRCTREACPGLETRPARERMHGKPSPERLWARGAHGGGLAPLAHERQGSCLSRAPLPSKSQQNFHMLPVAQVAACGTTTHTACC